MPPERVRDGQRHGGDNGREIRAKPQPDQQVQVRHRKGGRHGGDQINPAAELAEGNVLGPDGEDVIQRV